MWLLPWGTEAIEAGTRGLALGCMPVQWLGSRDRACALGRCPTAHRTGRVPVARSVRERVGSESSSVGPPCACSRVLSAAETVRTL